MARTSKDYHSDPRGRPVNVPEKEEKEEDLSTARRKAVKEAKSELSSKQYREGPTASLEETESPGIQKKERLVLPETKIVGDPHAAGRREQSAELEAATDALEDQQDRRLQNTLSEERWGDARETAELFGIPVGILTAGYAAGLAGIKEVISPADPVTAAYKPPRVSDVVGALGHDHPDLPSGIKPGGMEGAGTLKGQARAESARLSKEAHKIVGGADPRSASWKKKTAFERAVGAGTSAEEALKQADMSFDKRTGYPKQGVNWAGKGDWQFDPITQQEYDWGYDPKDTLHRSQETVAKDIKRGTAPSSLLEQKKYLQGKPAYGVSLPKGKYPAAFQAYKNLTAQAEELLRPISRRMGFMSPWLGAALLVITPALISYEVLDQLDEADSEAIPTTMRILARLNESPLLPMDVAPEATAKLSPEEVEDLHQDGTISYQLYRQLQ